MRSNLRRPAGAFLLGLALGGAILGATAAYGSLTTSGTINACYKPTNGSIYVIGEPGAPELCASNDLPIAWNAQGPAGPQGDPGEFSGRFVSSNGLYVLTVGDKGIKLAGPGGNVTVGPLGVAVKGVTYARVNAPRVALKGNCRPVEGSSAVYVC
jgi:hypothetical protein